MIDSLFQRQSSNFIRLFKRAAAVWGHPGSLLPMLGQCHLRSSPSGCQQNEGILQIHSIPRMCRLAAATMADTLIRCPGLCQMTIKSSCLHVKIIMHWWIVHSLTPALLHKNVITDKLRMDQWEISIGSYELYLQLADFLMLESLTIQSQLKVHQLVFSHIKRSSSDRVCSAVMTMETHANTDACVYVDISMKDHSWP